MELNDEYWSTRYAENQTGWDLKQVSTPLKVYIDQLENKQAHILIPGCGNAYEANYLVEKGFTNITLIDISAVLVGKLQAHFAGKPVAVIHGDFFEHRGQYDLILEQTFFCAIDPSLREKYAQHMQTLLKTGGKLSGVLFSRHFEGGPPFGGTIAEYQKLFSPYFHVKTMEPCYNSIAPRVGNEVFIIVEKSF